MSLGTFGEIRKVGWYYAGSLLYPTPHRRAFWRAGQKAEEEGPMGKTTGLFLSWGRAWLGLSRAEVMWKAAATSVMWV